MKSAALRGLACLNVALALTSALAAQTPPPDTGGQRIAAPTSQPIRERDRKKAAKLYLEGSKLFERGAFDEAMQAYEAASALVPDNKDYSLAAQVARSHAVSALIQNAAKDRAHGNAVAARAALLTARDLDPHNPLIAEHVSDLAADVVAAQPPTLYEDAANDLGESARIEPSNGVHSFHLKTDRRGVIQSVYKAYGIDATMDQSVPAPFMRFDLDDATFAQATQALERATDTFVVPLDAHRVLVARDTRQNRQQFERQDTETIYLPGLTSEELADVSKIAKDVFGTPQVAVSESRDTVTLRAPAENLKAFNSTMHDLMDDRSQVMLDVQIIQLAHTSDRNIGVQLPQQVTAFNVYTEEQAILNANQALVQQIISSGLAAPGDTFAILGILLASGQVSSSIFSNGVALFGGGITLSGLSPGPTTLHLNLNSSDSRALDNVRLRLADGQKETFRSGSRYPILTASYSGLNLSGVNIPGLTTAGASGSLTSLASSLAGAQTTIPQVQYQDLGLTLTTTPKVMRSGDVALTLDLTITALSGSSANGSPILNNRSYSGVITLKEGHGALLMSEVDQQESGAISGTPGLNEIPGMSGADDKETQKDYATLLIVLTPHLIEGPTSPGHTPMLRIEPGSLTP